MKTILSFSNTRTVELTDCEWKDLQTAIKGGADWYGCFDGVVAEVGDCGQCGGEICPHGICADNWCGHDEACAECRKRKNLEQDAEAEAQLYARKLMRGHIKEKH